MSAATVVTIYHPTNDSPAFMRWAGELRATASSAADFRVSVLGEPHLDWGIAVSFADEQALHCWLDGAPRRELLRQGESRGILRATADLVFVEGAGMPPGVGVFRHNVAAGMEAEFVSAEAQLAEASAHFGGFEGCCTFGPDSSGESFSVLRFRTDHQLTTWLGSPERIEALGPLRSSLSQEFSLVSSTTAFGTTIRTENGRTAITPKWKTAMLILLVLYPTVMLLSRFLGPLLDGSGAPPWLVLWLSQVVSVAALQWVLMPWAGRRFRRWLDPVDGAAVRTTAVGAAVVVAGYLATLALFAAVQWLQYWDYSRG
jgi:antibiotic biosynthesis monooxygenase (ABM) superfamily enzyme